MIVFKSLTMTKLFCLLIPFFFGMWMTLSCSPGKQTVTTSNSDQSIDDTTRRLAWFKGDTTAYLNFIVSKKQDYIGKPLSVFLNDLELPISSFSPSISQKNKTQTSGILIQTVDLTSYYNKIDNSDNKAYRIGITWQSLQRMDSVQAILNNNMKAGVPSTEWSLIAKEYFGKIIVGDIRLPYYLAK